MNNSTGTNWRNILIVGKLPPPYYGTSIWTNILYKSGFFLIFNSSTHRSLNTIGKFQISRVFKTFIVYLSFILHLKKYKPDITLIPISQSLIGLIKDTIYIFLAIKYSKKILIILHGGNFKNWYDHRSLFVKHFVRYILKYPYGAIVLADRLKNIFYPFYPVNRVYSAPNGLNIKFPSFKKNENHIITILYLGNLQPNKGIINIISSLVFLKECKIEFKVDIIGSWRDKITQEYAINMVQKWHLPVHFLGPMYSDEKYKHLKSADIFIFTPIAEEGHPFTIIEALAAGLPIISSNRGGIAESVIEDCNGFIVDPDDSKEIALKLRLLIENKELRLKMGKASRIIYEKSFTEEHMIERLKSIFREIDKIK